MTRMPFASIRQTFPSLKEVNWSATKTAGPLVRMHIQKLDMHDTVVLWADAHPRTVMAT